MAELKLVRQGLDRRAKRDHQARAWSVYHGGYFAQADPGRWPTLERLASLEPEPEVSQEERDDLQAAFSALARRLREV